MLHRTHKTFGTGLLLAILLGSPLARAATYKVGPTQTYKQLTAVADLLKPGDIVEVDGDATYQSVLFEQSGTAAAKITIRGMTKNGKRPVISGGTNTIEVAADHYVLENLEITGGSFRCYFHHGDDITMRGTVIHDCAKHGILGADNDSGSLLLEYSEVYKCGGGTFDHQIYMATDENAHPGSVFRMQFCYVHDANGGNSVKSRSERNEIYYNWIEGALYHELELIGPDPDGGVNENKAREDSDVVGNVLRKTNEFSVVRAGGDGTGQTFGRYRFVNNTILVRPNNSAVFRLFDGIESIEMHNNLIYSPEGGSFKVRREAEADWASGSATIAGTNNWLGQGATDIPAQWTNTLNGANPMLVGAPLNPQPTAASPLVNAGAAILAGPDGYPFPSPLASPAFHPPLASLLPVGTAASRPSSGVVDIGAFEYDGGSGGSGQGGSGSGGSSSGGSGGSGQAGSGTAGSGTAGSGTAGSGTAGTDAGGSGGSGQAGSSTAGSDAGGTDAGGTNAGGTDAGGAGGSDAGGSGGSEAAGSGAGGSGGSGQAGSGTAGSGTAGSGTAGSGTAGSGTAGSGTAGSGTAGSGTAGSGTAGSSAGGSGSGGKGGAGSSGTSGQGGQAGSAPASGGDAASEDDGGCGCRVAPAQQPRGTAWAPLLAAVAWGLRRKRQRRAGK